jgi:hypothetical protein
MGKGIKRVKKVYLNDMEPIGPPPELNHTLKLISVYPSYDDLVKRIIYLEKEVTLLKIIIDKHKLVKDV